MVLNVESLGKRYDRHWIFRKLSFHLEEHDCLAILGSNGSGKSTLLRTIAGLIPPTEGSINLPEGEIRHILGFSAIEGSLYPELTVAEHLELTGKLRGIDPNSTELLTQVGLHYAKDFFARELSTGMRARLRMAMAIQANPILLILDEPSAGLDVHGIKLLESIIESQLLRGSVIIASNDPNERRFANHELQLN